VLGVPGCKRRFGAAEGSEVAPDVVAPLRELVLTHEHAVRARTGTDSVGVEQELTRAHAERLDHGQALSEQRHVLPAVEPRQERTGAVLALGMGIANRVAGMHPHHHHQMLVDVRDELGIAEQLGTRAVTLAAGVVVQAEEQGLALALGAVDGVHPVRLEMKSRSLLLRRHEDGAVVHHHPEAHAALRDTQWLHAHVENAQVEGMRGEPRAPLDHGGGQSRLGADALGDVARHVEHAVGGSARDVGAHADGSDHGRAPEARSRRVGRRVAPRPDAAVRSARGLLPLGLRGQPPAHPLRVGECTVPRERRAGELFGAGLEAPGVGLLRGSRDDIAHEGAAFAQAEHRGSLARQCGRVLGLQPAQGLGVGDLVDVDEERLHVDGRGVIGRAIGLVRPLGIRAAGNANHERAVAHALQDLDVGRRAGEPSAHGYQLGWERLARPRPGSVRKESQERGREKGRPQVSGHASTVCGERLT